VLRWIATTAACPLLHHSRWPGGDGSETGVCPSRKAAGSLKRVGSALAKMLAVDLENGRLLKNGRSRKRWPARILWRLLQEQPAAFRIQPWQDAKSMGGNSIWLQHQTASGSRPGSRSGDRGHGRSGPRSPPPFCLADDIPLAGALHTSPTSLRTTSSQRFAQARQSADRSAPRRAGDEPGDASGPAAAQPSGPNPPPLGAAPR